MSQLSEKAKRASEYASVIIAIGLMVLASELLGENEIIFPEIAALSIGCFLSPKLCWKTSYLRMIVCIEICAVLGVCIVCFIPLPLWLQITLAYAAAQLVFMYSGTSLAPMISAIVLPVMMQTKGIVYPISALVLTSYIAAKRFVLEKYSVKEPNLYLPVPCPEKQEWRDFAFRTIVVTVLSFACVSKGAKFCIAPPLLVAFTELCKPDCPAGKDKTRLILLVTLCALSGELARLYLVARLGLPLTSAAIATGILVIVLIKAFKLYFPPAGAMAVLALIIPQEDVLAYTTEVCGGIALFSIAADFWVKKKLSNSASETSFM